MKKSILLLTNLFVLASLGVYAQSFSPVGPGNYTITSSSVIVDGNDIYADNLFMSGSDIFTFGKYSNGNWSKLGNWGSIIGINCAVKIGDDIYVGGHFVDATGNPDMDRIARWNITTETWHPLGTGLNAYVMSIAQMGNDIIVAGKFTDAGGDSNADYVAKWDGTSWSAIGSQVISTNSFTVVSSVAVNNNELYIGGNFYTSNGGATNYLAKWNGNAFESISGWNQAGAVYEIVFDANNNMYIGGEFPAKIAKYDGTNWDLMDNFTASGASWISNIKLIGSDIYIGGKFSDAKGIAEADNIAKFNGTTWEAVGGGLNDEVYGLTVSANDLYIAGKFTDAGGNTAADKLVKYSLSGTTGIDDFVDNSNFKIFPNPSNGQFTIQTEKGGIFELLDTKGKLINSYNINNTQQTIGENLPKGLYFIRELETNVTQKIVIK